MQSPDLNRRTFLKTSLAVAPAMLSFSAPKDAPEALADTPGKQVFSILHTNDMHSNVVGVGPLRDYTPLSLGDDQTRGGYARLGALIAQRKTELEVLAATTHLNADLAAIDAASREIKEWQAIMDYLVSLPNKTPDSISVLIKNDRAMEIRGIKSR